MSPRAAVVVAMLLSLITFVLATINTTTVNANVATLKQVQKT